MVEQDGKVNILLVDDKPDKLLAVEAVIEGFRLRAEGARKAAPSPSKPA